MEKPDRTVGQKILLIGSKAFNYEELLIEIAEKSNENPSTDLRFSHQDHQPTSLLQLVMNTNLSYFMMG